MISDYNKSVHIVQILGSIMTITPNMLKPCLDRTENKLIIIIAYIHNLN
jgi:hypothetical protein